MGTGLLANANPSVRSISAFFPCYNDARTIEAMVRAAGDALAQLVDDFEVIVVDDGSADDSVAVLERLQVAAALVADRRPRVEPRLRRRAAFGVRGLHQGLDLLHGRRRPVRPVRGRTTRPRGGS